MWTNTYHLAVLFGCMAILMWLVIRGRSIFVVAPFCALLALTLSGEDPLSSMTGAYLTGFADYIKRFYLIFALGAAFGKIMDESGAAVTVAIRVGRLLGTQRACLAVVLACALLTYGGVSLFVVGFSVYPLAVQLFRAADLPRRFIPGAIAFGSVTFTMTSAGSPEIQNLIPIQYLVDAQTGAPLTDARAGWPVSLIVGVLMFVSGQWYLERAIRNDVRRGRRFEHRADDREPVSSQSDARPGFVAAMLPLVVTLAALNLIPWLAHRAASWWQPSPTAAIISQKIHALFSRFPEDPTLAIFLGVVVAALLLQRRLPSVWTCFGDGFVNGLLAVGSTSAIVGFGAAIKNLHSFQLVVDWVTHLPGDPLFGAALAVAVIAAIAGSASGGQGIALPIIKPIYIDELGVAPRALHRVVAISSGTLDSLPANGFLVMLLRNICGETHARAYGPIFVTTVLIPSFGTLLAILLFKWFPQWGQW